MFGFFGRILIIDLTNKKADITPLPESVYRKYLGGKGLATYLLQQRNETGVDPLSPENHLIFATGPFCQSRLWGGSRYGVYTKSPLTGFYSESYSGGKVPEAMDSAGYDAVIIQGRSSEPVAISVSPEGADFFDARELWGKDNFETEKEAIEKFALNKPEYKKGAVVIGPAGENMVKYAIISNDKWRCAGRTGAGTVMGSKNLKAIVFQGDQKRKLYDPDQIKQYSKDFSKMHIKSPAVAAYRERGTTMMVSLMNTIGAFPSRYWHEGTCDHWKNINGDAFHKKHDIKPHACAKCFMACGRMTKITEGAHKGLKLEGPEYETIYAFGGLCMIEDTDQIVYLNHLCDRFGMDTITTGNLCALVMEAVSLDRLDYNIEYGNADQTADLIKKIVRREGIGDTLAEGIIPFAEKFNLQDIAIHVKGLEPSGYDPRILKGMGLTFATSPRGACHLRTTFYKPEIAGLIPPDQIENKAQMLVDYEDRLNIFDTMILCRFYRDFYTWDELEKSINFATGFNFTKQDLRKIAANIATMTRQFNLKEGLTVEDDKLPMRFLEEKLPSGESISNEEMQQMLDDYYFYRSWDKYGSPKHNDS